MATDKPTPEVLPATVRTSSDLAALNELEAILLNMDDARRTLTDIQEDPREAERQIIAQLLAAETDDDLEVVGNAEGWAELEGVPVEIRGFRWRPSEYKEGPPVYCVVFGNRVDDGSAVVLTTGSAGIMAQLCNLARRERIPGVIRKLQRADKATKGGFYPLRLVSTDAELAERARNRVNADAPAS